MGRQKLFLISLLASLLLFTFALSSTAQESVEFATFISADATLSFKYPTEWTVQENLDTGFVSLVSNANILERLERSESFDLLNDEIYIGLAAQTAANAPSVTTVKQGLLDLLPDASVRETFLAGRNAVIISGQVPREIAANFAGAWGDIFIIILNMDENGAALIMAMTKPGQLAPHETTIYAIAESIRVDKSAVNADLYFTSTFAEDDPTKRFWEQGLIDEFRKTEIADGHYRLIMLEKGAMISVLHNGANYEDSTVTMRVSIDPERDTAIRSYGIIFRYVDTDNYYLFEVFANGTYGVWIYQDRDYRSLLEGYSWPSNDAVLPVNSTNLIQVVAEGNEFTVITNGETLLIASDATFASGSAGIYFVANEAEHDIVLSLDEFSVSETAP